VVNRGEKSIHDKNHDEMGANGLADSFKQFKLQMFKYVPAAENGPVTDRRVSYTLKKSDRFERSSRDHHLIILSQWRVTDPLVRYDSKNHTVLDRFLPSSISAFFKKGKSRLPRRFDGTGFFQNAKVGI
jgi:hypothetical protein